MAAAIAPRASWNIVTIPSEDHESNSCASTYLLGDW
jgi:hypothetical protein